MAKHTNDVRALSANAAYMGMIFEGEMDDAIAQAQAAPDHGLAEQFVPKGMSRNRAVLLQHLNLLGDYKQAAEDDQLLDDLAAPSKYSLAYAISQGWFDVPFARASKGPDLDAMNFDPSN